MQAPCHQKCHINPDVQTVLPVEEEKLCNDGLKLPVYTHKSFQKMGKMHKKEPLGLTAKVSLKPVCAESFDVTYSMLMA